MLNGGKKFFPLAPAPDLLDALKWLDVEDAATYLRTTKGGVRNMVYRGQLVSYKPNGKLLFKRADLDRLIEKSRRD